MFIVKICAIYIYYIELDKNDFYYIVSLEDFKRN